MEQHHNKKEVDSLSGVETTGHEWDGLKELNNPAPRWWVWVFIATIVWSIGYWVVYPAWPTLSGATEGIWGWTQHKQLKEQQSEIFARQAAYLEKFNKAETLQDIMKDPELYAFAVAGGKTTFKDNCATCHGSGAQGSKGYPNLNDDDWIWGGKVEDIYQTLQYGIRSGHDDARISQMPAFGKDGVLTADQIKTVADYVIGLHEGKSTDKHPGYAIYQENCAVCHAPDGAGMREVGAPNLKDAIWLYGGDEKTVYETIFNARAGVMPFWKGRLNDATLRQLSVYVHSLGGGEKSE